MRIGGTFLGFKIRGLVFCIVISWKQIEKKEMMCLCIGSLVIEMDQVAQYVHVWFFMYLIQVLKRKKKDRISVLSCLVTVENVLKA